jgi:hypothetical protein
MTNKIIKTLGIAVVLAVIVATGYTVITEGGFLIAHADTCDSNPEADLVGSIASGISVSHGAHATVTNKSSHCSYKVGLALYRVYDEDIKNQTLYDNDVKTIEPNKTIELHVSVPDCKYQVDLFYGDLVKSFQDQGYYGTRKLDALMSEGDNLCRNTPPPEQKAELRIVKTVRNDDGGTRNVSDFALYINDTRVTSGEYKTLSPGTYTVRENNVSGYTAGSWGGDCSSDGHVTLTNGDRKTCTITNDDNPRHTPPPHNDNLNVTCSADRPRVLPGGSLTFTATVTGGSGSNSYSWTGSDNLSGSGSSVTSSWNSLGTKYARVRVTSGNQTDEAECSAEVESNNGGGGGGSYDRQLFGSCWVNPSAAYLGEDVTWNASAQGGTDSYSYSWNGSDNFYGNGSSMTRRYGYAGQKFGTVTISSGNQTITRTCTVDIRPNQVAGYTYTYQPPTQTSGVYLSQVPYTGIDGRAKIALFILGLFAWSALITYFLLKRKARKEGITIGEALERTALQFAPAGATVEHSMIRPAPLLTAASSDEFIATLEERARADRIIIAADGLSIIAVMTGRDETHALRLIDRLAEEYRGYVQNESDWIVLNAQKVSKIIHD